MWDSNVNVYGLDERNGTLAGSDYNSGTRLGTWTLPANPTVGQLMTYDVTAFVKSTRGPYFGFLLQAVGDVFGSTSVNAGTPPELFVIFPAPLPQLTAKRAGNQMIISWPTNYSAGLSLQSTAILGNGAAWNPVSAPPMPVGNQWMVTNAISGTNCFFRLSSQ